MFCPVCGSYNAVVIDSRDEGTLTRRRRRKCADCGYRWSTMEIELNRYNRLLEFESAIMKAVDQLNEIEKPKENKNG